MPCIGLAAAAAAGCVRVMELLEDEIRIALALLGVSRWKELDATYLHRGAPVVAVPRVTSAFPLLDEPGY
jgi:isopentenyl diphosphate isomerase/L-lactate dehydrogenase-like FMN-dependent dehydrogenase